jgi:hypothetical protein
MSKDGNRNGMVRSSSCQEDFRDAELNMLAMSKKSKTWDADVESDPLGSKS